MKTFISCLVLVCFSVAASGEEGFRFPGGDVDKGKNAFVQLNCYQCHTVQGVELQEPKNPRKINLTLAKKARFVENYEDLITAITNPQHVVDQQYAGIIEDLGAKGQVKPFMPEMIDHMSARQLMDLVAFLNSVYRNMEGYER